MTSTPPQNLDAENCVIGTILYEEKQLEVATETLQTQDFYNKKNQKIFESFLDLKRTGKNIDLISMVDSLEKHGALELVGGAAALAELADKAIGSFHFEGLCHIIKEKSLARQLVGISREIQERALGQKFSHVGDLIAYAQKQVFDIDVAAGAKDTLFKVHDVITSSMHEIEKRFHAKSAVLGISSGFAKLDELTNGFKPGELIIVAARPSMGKTAFSLNLAHNISVIGKKRTAYFSIEMPKETLVMRMFAASAGIPLDKVVTGRLADADWPKLINSASGMAEAPLLIDDSNPLSPNELRSRCRRAKLSGGLDCVMVDYLQMMRVKDQRMDSREREVAEISATLKAIAKEMQIPVIALAQLNRDAEKRPDKRPGLSDLRESGAIEMDADVIMMLYREDYYDRENPQVQGQAEIIVGKNRNGRTGVAKMKFSPALNRFSDG